MAAADQGVSASVRLPNPATPPGRSFFREQDQLDFPGPRPQNHTMNRGALVVPSEVGCIDATGALPGVGQNVGFGKGQP